jgi:hypothetical protein
MYPAEQTKEHSDQCFHQIPVSWRREGISLTPIWAFIHYWFILCRWPLIWLLWNKDTNHESIMDVGRITAITLAHAPFSV